MNDQQRELAPCPFCGSKAEILTLEGETDDPSIGAQCVQCTSRSCGAASGLVFPLMDNVTDLLAERWNTRGLTQPQAQQAAAAPASDVRGLLREVLELQDNWPGIAYTADFVKRCNEALADPQASVKSKLEEDAFEEGFRFAEKCHGITTTTPPPPVMQSQNLSAVITWLENGCNVQDAINELKILQGRATSAPAVPLSAEHIDKIREALVEKMLATGMLVGDDAWDHSLARAIERAHDITEPGAGGESGK